MDITKMQEVMSQAREMQQTMRQKLSQTVVEASSGGGAVTVKMNGEKQVLKVTIDPSAVLGLSSNAADGDAGGPDHGSLQRSWTPHRRGGQVERIGHAGRPQSAAWPFLAL